MSHVRTVDAAGVAAALPPDEAVAAIASALRGGLDPAADVARSVVPTSAGHLLLMPSEWSGHVGVKVATVAPSNPAAGLARIQASYLLHDAATLTLRAILDGTALTTLRTPAVSVAAARPALERLGRPPRVVLLGAGPQAAGHLDAIRAVAGGPLPSVDVVTRRTAWPRRGDTGVRSLRAGTPEVDDAVAAADVVVCATSARTPLFDGALVAPHAVVIAVGSHEPDVRELDAALLARSTVVVEDVATALREAGDVVLARSEGALDAADLVPMRDVVTGVVMLPDDRPVVVKTVGMPWEDLVVAAAVVDRTG